MQLQPGGLRYMQAVWIEEVLGATENLHRRVDRSLKLTVEQQVARLRNVKVLRVYAKCQLVEDRTVSFCIIVCTLPSGGFKMQGFPHD